MALRKGFPSKLSGSAADADDVRYDMAGTVVRDSTGVPRSGLFAPVSAALLTSTATFNVSVAAFAGVAVRDGGPIFLANDGAANILITAGAPASNQRLDVLYAKQNDTSATVAVPDANNLPIFGVLAGTPSATPVRNPAGLPAGALELGTILVPSTATATNSAGVVITPTFQYTCMNGGVLPIPNNTSYPVSPNPGDLVRRLDKGRIEQYFATGAGGKTIAGWYQVNGNPEVGAVTAFGGSSLDVTSYLTKSGGRASMYINCSKSPITSGGQVASIPAAFRPKNTILTGAAMLTSGVTAGAASLQVGVNGEVYFYTASSVNQAFAQATWDCADVPVFD